MNIKRNATLIYRYMLFVFLFGYTSVSLGNPYIIYVPIAVSDITILIPIYNDDINGDGSPDYDDPSISPEDVFAVFSAALMTGNADTAVKFIGIEKQERYAQAFDDLGSDAGSIVAGIENTTVLFSNEDMVELIANRTDDGKLKAVIVTLLREKDGVWRIVGL